MTSALPHCHDDNQQPQTRPAPLPAPEPEMAHVGGASMWCYAWSHRLLHERCLFVAVSELSSASTHFRALVGNCERIESTAWTKISTTNGATSPPRCFCLLHSRLLRQQRRKCRHAHRLPGPPRRPRRRRHRRPRRRRHRRPRRSPHRLVRRKLALSHAILSKCNA
jgi:hypothetical protein